MATPLRSIRSIQQRLLSSKEGIRSVLSYNRYRNEDPVCSDKQLEIKLLQMDKELGRLLEYVKTLESKVRREDRKRSIAPRKDTK